MRDRGFENMGNIHELQGNATQHEISGCQGGWSNAFRHNDAYFQFLCFVFLCVGVCGFFAYMMGHSSYHQKASAKVTKPQTSCVNVVLKKA